MTERQGIRVWEVYVAALSASCLAGLLLYPYSIEKKINLLLRKYDLKTENVLGNPEPEKFYEIEGRRVYLEIDGKSIEQYFQPEKQ